MAKRGELALVLSGGGARAAYQVGVLKSLAERRPAADFQILTGVSAGAINAAYLANHTGDFAAKIDGLYELWSHLTGDRVFRTGGFSLAKRVLRWGITLVGGGLDLPRPARGMVDTEPLRQLLRGSLESPGGRLQGVDENLESGRLSSVAITSSSYSTGRSVTWVHGRAIKDWERAHRVGRSCALDVEHVMASSSLPLLFPAVRLENEAGESEWFGDGGIRLSAPLSPAVQLGAERILAVSTRYAKTRAEAAQRATDGYPPPAQVFGSLLSAVFLDLLDNDGLRLERINSLLKELPPEKRGDLRPVELLILRPSQDLGKLANDYEPRLDAAFRFFTRGLGTKRTRSNDLLSLIMFQSDYLNRLLELGVRDGEARIDELLELLEV